MENEKRSHICLLDLPESHLDCVLKHLSPQELCIMSEACSVLRKRCSGDDLWEEHIKRKWGPVIGEVVYNEWKWHIASAKEDNTLRIYQNGSLGTFSGDWPFLSLGSYLDDSEMLRGSLSNYFMKSLYFSVESGKFWFPAQIYRANRFLCCHHGLLSYDSETDSFQARKQSGGWELIGKSIGWDKVRATPVETPPNALHVSHLSNLKPGDHIEIQFRTSRQTFYDWWHATIEHLETCNEHGNHCGCDQSEVVVVEFKQYSPVVSQMRRLVLTKNNYQEHDDGMGRLFGGIRKIHSQQQIDTWKSLFAQPYLRTYHNLLEFDPSLFISAT
ncbi:hypothetical protein QN277_013400 [Acacia crassicarpa]|uniref:F-box domain-containing protein n=1 Tax=Acacia crassicarpa TaxID=499986 RepID=A0AAE1N2B9_9FABA|nr:hypothetical protein QN277_013400 [Acacia crassicarpa]